MYLALDIETTGLDPEVDKIIEVAAVLFEKGKIHKQFSKLVNPLIEIPEIVTHITGITNEDVQGAPTIQEVQAEIEQFIGDYPIMGHFISFDTGFLKAKGFKITNAEYDSHTLARLLLPRQTSYSLETITEELGLSHENKHRALDDCLACIDLFEILLDKIEEIPETSLKKIKYALERSEHQLYPLFEKATGSLAKSTPKAPEFQKEQATIDIDKEEVLNIYNDQALLEEIHSDYQKRNSQVEMSSAILDAFEQNYHYIIEAGTGTGKSMAYLLPAAHKALTENEKVVIATHTKTLQDQLINKDIPQIEKIIEKLTDGKRKLRACTLKGKSNYLSKKRFEIFAGKEDLTPEEAMFVCKVELWLNHTKTGDVEELNLQWEERFLFLNVSCQDEDYFSNPAFKDGSYLLKARKRAQSSDIIVVNHSLLAQDFKTPSALIPEYRYIIIDEAHHIEEGFTKAGTKQISLERTCKMFRELNRVLSKVTKKLKPSLFITETEVEEIKDSNEELEKLESKLEIIFGLLGIFFNAQCSDSSGRKVIITEHNISTHEWGNIQQACETLNHSLHTILESISKLLDKSTNPEFSAHLANLQKVITLTEILREWRENFEGIFLKYDSNNKITWISEMLDQKLIVLQATINIGEELKEIFYEKKDSIILSSATLSANNSFSFIRDRLQLGEHFEEFMLESHFNYPDQVEIVVPTNLPGPQNPNYMDKSIAHIENAIRKFDGHTLVLFTAKRSVETVYMALAPKMKKEGFEIYAQGLSGGKGKIIEKFRHNPKKRAIFGTNTFWEGVDIKGDSLQCVIIHKLPFDPPIDPIHIARSQGYMNSFMEYSIPRALTRFRQGFGRLIRSESDTGTFMALDGRIRNKRYGQLFIDALPHGIKLKEDL